LGGGGPASAARCRGFRSSLHTIASTTRIATIAKIVTVPGLIIVHLLFPAPANVPDGESDRRGVH
jgi:hypothetical protein